MTRARKRPSVSSVMSLPALGWPTELVSGGLWVDTQVELQLSRCDLCPHPWGPAVPCPMSSTGEMPSACTLPVGQGPSILDILGSSPGHLGREPLLVQSYFSLGPSACCSGCPAIPTYSCVAQFRTPSALDLPEDRCAGNYVSHLLSPLRGLLPFGPSDLTRSLPCTLPHPEG